MNLETVKIIIRSVTVAIVISLYFAGWIFYIHMCSKDRNYGSVSNAFYAVWTVLHISAIVIGFIWAWM